MEKTVAACRALYDICFPGEDGAFADALFAQYAPEHLHTVKQNGEVVAMLFSIPYPVLLENGVQNAHYLYAVATHPAHRGQGHARTLLDAQAARGPVFLRPMSPRLFDFYEKVGFVPFSPLKTVRSEVAIHAPVVTQALTPEEYARRRARIAPYPTCAPTVEFLSLAMRFGGAVAVGDEALALFERAGQAVRFKEWWGDVTLAPRVAASLGATEFELRHVSDSGISFGVMRGLPANAAFLAAMD